MLWIEQKTLFVGLIVFKNLLKSPLYSTKTALLCWCYITLHKQKRNARPKKENSRRL